MTRVRARRAVAFVVLMVPGAAAAQEAPRVVLRAERAIGGESPLPHLEPHIAVNPRDGGNFIVAAIRADSSWYGIVAMATTDGGISWHETHLPACDFDPWVAFLASGEALLSCLGRADGPTPIYVFRSSDGGRAWGETAEVPLAGGSFDRPSMTPTSGSQEDGAGVVVIAMHAVRDANGRLLSGPALSMSLDRGVTFSAPLRLQPSNAWANVLNPVVMPDGRIGFAFFDYAVNAPPDSAGRDFRQLRTPRVWWVSSTDGGESFSFPHLVTEVHAITSGHVAVDGSTGSYRGRLYYVMDDVRDGSGGVFVYRSDDAGATWSDARRLSRDGAEGVRRLPTAVVNTRGQLLVAWLQPHGTAEDLCWQLTVSGSSDGGETFTAPTPATAVQSCNRVPGNEVPRRGGRFQLAVRWPAGGDYFGIAAVADGSFRIVWPDSRSGSFRLRMVDVAIEPSPSGER